MTPLALYIMSVPDLEDASVNHSVVFYIVSLRLNSLLLWVEFLTDCLVSVAMAKQGRKPVGGKGKQASAAPPRKHGRKKIE